jgi:small subunit ribosomal protein S8
MNTIAFFITQLRNGYSANRSTILVQKSKKIINLLNLLIEEGFIERYVIIKTKKKSKIFEHIEVFLKYHHSLPLIQNIRQISRPGRRVYVKSESLGKTHAVFKVYFISTSIGIVTGIKAQKLKIGGEVLFSIF